MLARGLESLAPGGTLVYSVCTISRREGADVVAAALAAVEGRELEPAALGAEQPQLADDRDDRFLQTLPDRDRTDGFFIARIEAAT
jgi:16S rRNA (cytosine967-C5)-methyltransferase